MKNKERSSLHFLGNPLKSVPIEASSDKTPPRSPYLKAILSGTARIADHIRDIPAGNPDHAAALRYIKESALLRRS